MSAQKPHAARREHRPPVLGARKLRLEKFDRRAK
jgi:hypothetical protein